MTTLAQRYELAAAGNVFNQRWIVNHKISLIDKWRKNGRSFQASSLARAIKMLRPFTPQYSVLVLDREGNVPQAMIDAMEQYGRKHGLRTGAMFRWHDMVQFGLQAIGQRKGGVSEQ